MVERSATGFSGSVGVGSVFEKRPCDMNVPFLSGAVKWAQAVVGSKADICSSREQSFRHFHVVQHDCVLERRAPLLIQHVFVVAPVQHELHDVRSVEGGSDVERIEVGGLGDSGPDSLQVVNNIFWGV